MDSEKIGTNVRKILKKIKVAEKTKKQGQNSPASYPLVNYYRAYVYIKL